MTTARLVTMANQIARFFEGQPGQDAIELTADHLKSFWDRRMRADLVRHLKAGGAGLAPIAAGAATRLQKAQAAAAPATHAPSVGTRHDDG